MAKYDSYVDQITLEPITKASVRSLQPPRCRDRFPIIEAEDLTLETFKGCPENDPFEGEATYLPPDESAVWTFGVATCHVICMYGWDIHILHCGVALLHLTDAHTLSEGLAECSALLGEHGRIKNITAYIIGGQPDSDYKLLEGHEGHKVRGIVAPLTTNRGGAAIVAATRNGMAFNVNDLREEDS